MNNLMKAEFFRLRHTGFLKLIILLDLTAVFFQFVGDEGLEINAHSFFFHAMMGFSMALCCTSCIVCSTFNDRCAYYEVMKGTPPIQMILYRIIITLSLVTAVYFLPTVILLKISDGENFTLPMILLLFVCIAKLTVFFVSMCVIFNGVVGTILAMLMVVFNSMPLVILQNIAHINVVPLTSYLTTTQIMLIGDLPMLDLEEIALPLDTSYTGLKVVISFIVLSALMILAANKLLRDRKQFDALSAD